MKESDATLLEDEEVWFSCDDEDSKEQEKEDKKVGGKKKTKLRVVPQEQVDYLLNYKYEPKYLNRIAKENREKSGYRKTLASVAAAFVKRQEDLIRSAQEEMRREIEAKGVYTYEVTDDEAEDDNEPSV